MAFEIDSIISFTSEPSSSAVRPIRSLLWKHTRIQTPGDPPRNNQNKPICECKYECSYSTIISTNFKKHLLNIHNISLDEPRTKIGEDTFQRLLDFYRSSEHTGLNEPDQLVLQKILNQDIIDKAISQLITTSPNRILLLSIVAHYIDRTEEVPQRVLLGLKEVGNYSSSEQLEVLLPVLQDYGIVRRLGTIIGDNASTNDKLCQLLSQYLQVSKI
ncbi:hypothetical protein M501DRAFT_284243 [Patellaria atrata CBS 101060]|uniref:Uncharacterized protein n=1 Tax=Patellaria atrata CBS 101060 TaxID=1346257 RepID=A0A9P4S6B8_9PEZI|nr:hypothetical protein M501DRAFT_284243 [Patellaria atrata CBS 101060]